MKKIKLKIGGNSGSEDENKIESSSIETETEKECEFNSDGKAGVVINGNIYSFSIEDGKLFINGICKDKTLKVHTITDELATFNNKESYECKYDATYDKPFIERDRALYFLNMYSSYGCDYPDEDAIKEVHYIHYNFSLDNLSELELNLLINKIEEDSKKFNNTTWFYFDANEVYIAYSYFNDSNHASISTSIRSSEELFIIKNSILRRDKNTKTSLRINFNNNTNLYFLPSYLDAFSCEDGIRIVSKPDTQSIVKAILSLKYINNLSSIDIVLKNKDERFSSELFAHIVVKDNEIVITYSIVNHEISLEEFDFLKKAFYSVFKDDMIKWDVEDEDGNVINSFYKFANEFDGYVNDFMPYSSFIDNSSNITFIAGSYGSNPSGGWFNHDESYLNTYLSDEIIVGDSEYFFQNLDYLKTLTDLKGKKLIYDKAHSINHTGFLKKTIPEGFREVVTRYCHYIKNESFTRTLVIEEDTPLEEILDVLDVKVINHEMPIFFSGFLNNSNVNETIEVMNFEVIKYTSDEKIFGAKATRDIEINTKVNSYVFEKDENGKEIPYHLTYNKKYKGYGGDLTNFLMTKRDRCIVDVSSMLHGEISTDINSYGINNISLGGLDVVSKLLSNGECYVSLLDVTGDKIEQQPCFDCLTENFYRIGTTLGSAYTDDVMYSHSSMDFYINSKKCDKIDGKTVFYVFDNVITDDALDSENVSLSYRLFYVDGELSYEKVVDNVKIIETRWNDDKNVIEVVGEPDFPTPDPDLEPKKVTYDISKNEDGSIDITWSNGSDIDAKFFTIGDKKVLIPTGGN